ncbi:MAG: hypothetical protein J3Q66DRAFT_324083 [Benniella sp.]|nr:MAG: hypothetical protein J3Q66DRAFT_324083 [Benniella sp.]
MSAEPTTKNQEPIPKFASTLVIAFPDVQKAGPKILLSATSASTNGTSIPAWSHYCSKLSSSRKGKSAGKTSDGLKIGYSTTTLSDQPGASLLTIAAAPPTTEQATYLCEAIVNHARASGTGKIILVAASNFTTKDAKTHALKLHYDGVVGFPDVPKDVPLGDHILNTFLTLLTFADIPTIALVHPAQKGMNIRESQAVIEGLIAGLASVLGDNVQEFSAERAFQCTSVLPTQDEEGAESLMYL